jgi:hypothetical protein
VAALLSGGVPRFVARVARHFTARRNILPAYKGRGRCPVYGERVRPMPRTHKGKLIAATPPEATAQWGVAGRTVQAQVWDNLVLSTSKPGAPAFRCAVIHDPRSQEPWGLATNLPVSASALWCLYRDRWPVGSCPWRPSRCSARTARSCLVVRAATVCRSGRCWLATSWPLWPPPRRRWPQAFGIGAAVRRVGACGGCCCAWIFPSSPYRKAHCGKRHR